jgi:hypothetical protein
MKHKILYSTMGAILLLGATTALALAWPNQPPEKVLISGPGIEGSVEVKDAQALAIFRLGYLEDLEAESPMPPLSPAPPQFGAGYKIVRFFYGGDFDFARLTYYPHASGERGYLYFEDGPMLQGDHTPYNQTWLYAKPDAEKKLRALLKPLGAKLDDAAASSAPPSSSANANASSSESTLPRGAAQSMQNANAGELDWFSSAIIALVVGVAGVLGAAGALLLRRVRRTQGAR